MSWFPSELDLELVTCYQLETSEALIVARLIEDLMCCYRMCLRTISKTETSSSYYVLPLWPQLSL